jgi:Protein of unknown function (DUF3800)
MDESGTPDMGSIDPDYPLFILNCCLFKKNDYVNSVLPKVADFKMRWFGHDQVILRSYDIRKAQGHFGFLTDPKKRVLFLDDLTLLIETIPFTIIAVIIKKDQHKQRYVNPIDPYELALEFSLERLGKCIQSVQPDASTQKTNVMIERRGKKEDGCLELIFRRLMDEDRLKSRAAFEPFFLDKKANTDGLQIADLCCHPLGQKMMRPEYKSRAYDSIESKIYRAMNGVMVGHGLKVFP